MPAQYRSILKKFSHAGENAVGAPVVLRPSHQYPCIEGWPEKEFETLSAPLNAFDRFSPEHDDLSLGLFGDAFTTETDREGRIILPADMVAYANLKDGVLFMGANKTFQIWEPAAGMRRLAEARARIRMLTLRNGQ